MVGSAMRCSNGASRLSMRVTMNTNSIGYVCSGKYLEQKDQDGGHPRPRLLHGWKHGGSNCRDEGVMALCKDDSIPGRGNTLRASEAPAGRLTRRRRSA